MPLYHLLHFVKQIIWQRTSSTCAIGFDSGNLRCSDDARNAQAAFGKVSPAILFTVLRGWGFPVALGPNDSLDFSFGALLADGVAVLPFVCQERLDLVADHPEERCKAIDIVRLFRRQDETERLAFGIASGMEFGGKSAA
jgi:hypothetical protein